MIGPQIKICGINATEALDAAIAGRADYVGFVFFPPSPRNLTLSDAAALSVRNSGRLKKVGLFVNASDGEIAEAVAAAQLDVLQLHGSETPERAAQLRARYSLPVWKAISVAGPGDVEQANRYAQAVDLVLFDAKTPKGAALPGGMGLAFDWNLLKAYKGPLPWGLAGGLGPANVAEALRLTGAPLLDVSSGVESAAGVKDPEKIAEFCRNASG